MGASYTKDGYSMRATLWNGSTTTDLGTLDGGAVSYAEAINDAGQVVGSSDIMGHTANHATLWNGTTAIDLGTLGGTSSYTHDINSAGQVVGKSQITGDTFFHATLWNGTTATDLGGLSGFDSYARAINDAGLVVGVSSLTARIPSPTAQRATLWSGSTAIDLNSFLDASTKNAGWHLMDATAINNNGWIVGDAYNSMTGVQHAYLLTPVPEPSTYVMALAGLGLLRFAVRRSTSVKA